MKNDLISIVNEVFKDVVQPRLYSAAGRAMRDVRNQIIEEWFGSVGADPTSMIHAFVYPKIKGSVSIEGGELNVMTYPTPALYNHNQNIQQWQVRHGNPLESPELYVMCLQLFDGIVGLPKYGIETGWVNHNYIETTPLYDVLSDAGQWSEFKDFLIEYI